LRPTFEIASMISLVVDLQTDKSKAVKFGHRWDINAIEEDSLYNPDKLNFLNELERFLAICEKITSSNKLC
jgi:hypothetical protein